MSDSQQSLRRQIDGAVELASVVRTMKALAAASIGQYERAAHSLEEYYRTVELGLVACFRPLGTAPAAEYTPPADAEAIGAVIFGSDQGLVGQFNDVLADYAMQELAALPGEKRVWAVGERIHGRLADAGLIPAGLFAVPNSVAAITPLVGQILLETEAQREQAVLAQVHVFHNRPAGETLYQPVRQRLLPLDGTWRRGLAQRPWPSNHLAEAMGGIEPTLRALVREYLFVSLFQACAESLAGENASRLAAMQRAEKNIGELLENLRRTYHRLRQNAIDEELFDVIAGYESLSSQEEKRSGQHSSRQSR